MAVNLLACMLARLWPAAEANAILSELVDGRKKQIRYLYDGREPSHIAPLAASQQEITHKELAEWDASARAWISIANKAKITQNNSMEELLLAGDLPVDTSPVLYEGVMRSWNTAMSTISSLIQGMPHRVHDGAVLLAISAWHLYPDIEIFAPKIKYIASNDPLFQDGGRLTLGLQNANPESAQGVYWSLHLARLRYYGDPVEVTRTSTEETKVSFEDFSLIVLGSLFGSWAGKWFTPNLEVLDEAQVIIKLWETVENSASENETARQFVTITDKWMKVLVSAARTLTETTVDELPKARRLVLAGARGKGKLLVHGGGKPPPCFGLLAPTTILLLLNDSEARIEALRKIAELRGMGEPRTLISYKSDETGQIEYATAVPIDRPIPKRSLEGQERAARGHIRWIPTAVAVRSRRRGNCGCATGCTTTHCTCRRAGVSCDDSCQHMGGVFCENQYGLDEPLAPDNPRKRLIEGKGEVCMGLEPDNIFPESQSLSWYNPPSCLELGVFATETMSPNNGSQAISNEEAAGHLESAAADWAAWENDVTILDRFNAERTRKFNCILGNLEEAALLVLENKDGDDVQLDTGSPELSITEVLNILQLGTVDATRLLVHLISIFTPSYVEGVTENRVRSFLTSMKTMGAASRIYKLLPGALVSLRLLDGSIPNLKRVPERHLPASPSIHSIFCSFDLDRSEALACVSTFDAGTLLISPTELKDVLAVSSGNSIYAPSSILSDPHERCKEFELTRIVGNVGQAGVTMLIPPVEPRIVKPGQDSWKVINHMPFDLKCEDCFGPTTLHLSFTGYEQSVASSVRHGARDVEARYMETLVSVFDGSKWVADLDILAALRDDHLVRLELPADCAHSGGSQPRWTSIDSWDELIEKPAEISIIRAHGNSLARLAAVVIAFQKDKSRCIVLPESVSCYECIMDFLVEKSWGSDNIVLIC